MIKKFCSLIMPILAASLIVGCSNSPVSVIEADNTDLKTAALNDVQMQDIAAWGTDIWGLSTQAANGYGDYYIYHFNIGTNNWEGTWNYGKKISVGSDGLCYHYNSANAIWVVSPDGGFQFAAPPAGTITDISVGVLTGGTQSVWVVVGSQIYQWYNQQWVNRTSGHYGTFAAIGCDPGAGEAVATVGSSYVQFFNGYTWGSRPGYTNSRDVAIAGAWILFIKNGTLYKSFSGECDPINYGVGSFGVTGDYGYYYYISNQGYVQQGVNTWD